MCKELDELIKQERAEERTKAIKNMLLIGGSKEKIIELGYSEDEYEKAFSLLNEK